MCFYVAFFFFNLGSSVKESITHLNVSAKKEIGECREQGFSSFYGKSNTKIPFLWSELVLFVSTPHSSYFFLHASPNLLVTPFLFLPI